MQDKNGTLSVLIVEDDDDQRMLFSMFVSRMGFSSVHEACGIEPALRILRESSIDIMVSDYRLSSTETGVDLLVRCQEFRPKCSILLTGSTFSQHPVGFDLILYKPIDLQDFQANLRAVCRKFFTCDPVTT